MTSRHRAAPRRPAPRCPSACFAAALLAALTAPAARAQVDPGSFVQHGVHDLGNGTLDVIAELLPEYPRQHAAWLAPDVSATLLLTEDSFVEVVLAREDTDRRHALGYFTHDAAGTPQSRQLVFPDLSLTHKGVLAPGDSVILRDVLGEPRSFPAGTRLGFFLAAHGAQDKAIKQWDALTATLPSTDPALNAAVGEGLFTTLDALNPESVDAPARARHAVLLDEPNLLVGAQPTYLLGFESQDRRSPHADHDFNDVIVIVRLAAVDEGDLLAVNPNDPDGDGLRGTHDAWPTDAERGTALRVPASGLRVLGLDDEYPAPGNGDMNDAVLGWSAQLVLDGEGDVKEIVFDAHLLARGSSGNHALGLHLPGLPADATGWLRVERFDGPANSPLESEPPRALADVIAQDERRIETLLPSTLAALPSLPGVFGVNVTDGQPQAYASSSRMQLEFDDPVPLDTLGPPPWDVYWLIDTPAGLADVHAPGFDAFDDHPAALPEQTGDDAFVNAEGWPWLMELPRQQRFPLEGHPVEFLYPKLFPWALTHGQEQRDWPDKLSASKGGAHAGAYLLPRAFTLAPELP